MADLSLENPSVPPTSGRCLFDELPAEILMQIFSLGMTASRREAQDFTDDGSSVSGDVDEEELDLPWELLVSRVCRRWRDTAIQTVALWTTLEFFGDESLNRFKAYLQRSKDAPLDVTIELMEEPETYGATADFVTMWISQIRQIFAIIMPCAYRWRSLRIRVLDYRPMAKALVELGKCSGAPLLETLELDVYSDDDPHDPFRYPSLKKQDFVIFHGSVPKLKTLRLAGAFLDWPRYHGLSGLTSLELQCHAYDVRPNYDDFSRILRESPHLTSLALSESSPFGKSTEWDTSHITLSSLKHLEIGHIKRTDTIALLSRLAMPNLIELSIDFDECGNCEGILFALASPHPVTRRSIFSQLEALRLGNIACGSRRTIEQSCAALDDVRELELGSEMALWYKYLSSKKETDGTVFFPKLEKLHLNGLSAERVYRLVRERTRWSRSLRIVHVKLWGTTIEKEHEDWLRENLESIEFENSMHMHHGFPGEDSENEGEPTSSDEEMSASDEDSDRYDDIDSDEFEYDDSDDEYWF